VLLLFEFFFIANPTQNTLWFKVKELLNSNSAIKDIAFEVDGAVDKYKKH